MQQDELRAKINRLAQSISIAPARTKKEEEFAEAIMLGLSILGELLIDIKRIADAADRMSGH